MAIAKVEIYAMGKVPRYPVEELQQLQKIKQTDRKEFEKTPYNQKRLDEIKDLMHSYQRSQEMFASIKHIGMTDSVEDVNKLIAHLLEIGDRVAVETCVDHRSILEGPNGQLRVLSTWVILPDGSKYLSTLKFIPRKGV